MPETEATVVTDRDVQPLDGAIRLVQPSSQLIALWGEGARIKMSFDPKTPKGAELLFRATLDKLVPLRDIANKKIRVQHVFQHPAEKFDQETGEVKPFIRSVVIDADGVAYDCGSEGVQKALEIIEMVRGKAPWNPPISCTVIVRQTTPPRSFMVLRPDAEDLFINETTPKG